MSIRYVSGGLVVSSMLLLACNPNNQAKIQSTKWQQLATELTPSAPLAWRVNVPNLWEINLTSDNSLLQLRLGTSVIYQQTLLQQQTVTLNGSCLFTNQNELSCLLPPSADWLARAGEQLSLEDGEVSGCFYLEEQQRSLCPNPENLLFLNTNLLDGKPEFRLTKFEGGMPTKETPLSWRLCDPLKKYCLDVDLGRVTFH